MANFQVDCVEVRMSHTIKKSNDYEKYELKSLSTVNLLLLLLLCLFFEFKLKNFLCGNTLDSISYFNISRIFKLFLSEG